MGDARATSIDGTSFSFRSPVDGLELQPGSYAMLAEHLGQVHSVQLVPGESSVHGLGILLEDGVAPFHDLPIARAREAEVNTWVESARPPRAGLDVGGLAAQEGVRFLLDAGGFDRHTFLCGQSGSGKTYALGVVLERLLHETELRIVVLDPNSDFVRLADAREDAAADAIARHGEVEPGILVRRAGDGPDRLAVVGKELDRDLLAAALELDPIADREEYSMLVELAGQGVAGIQGLLETETPLAARIRNLGAADWGVWARGEPVDVVKDVFDPDARCVVVDLGSLPTREEQSLVATTVLDALWRERTRREPVLIVIDEAHNVCPADPGDPLTRLSTDLTVRIAAEGRKFGLYLLVSTQRPQKVAENALTQCDNLILMRMNSRADLAFVGDVFSFVPPGLLERATDFRQGECLVAGKIEPHPAFLRIGARFTHEGGGDVPAEWAASR